MRNQEEILLELDYYKEQLAMAIEEKTVYDNANCPDIDLLILSLVDKLEILLWVLDMELLFDESRTAGTELIQ